MKRAELMFKCIKGFMMEMSGRNIKGIYMILMFILMLLFRLGRDRG